MNPSAPNTRTLPGDVSPVADYRDTERQNRKPPGKRRPAITGVPKDQSCAQNGQPMMRSDLFTLQAIQRESGLGGLYSNGRDQHTLRVFRQRLINGVGG